MPLEIWANYKGDFTEKDSIYLSKNSSPYITIEAHPFEQGHERSCRFYGINVKEAKCIDVEKNVRKFNVNDIVFDDNSRDLIEKNTYEEQCDCDSEDNCSCENGSIENTLSFLDVVINWSKNYKVIISDNKYIILERIQYNYVGSLLGLPLELTEIIKNFVKDKFKVASVIHDPHTYLQLGDATTYALKFNDKLCIYNGGDVSSSVIIRIPEELVGPIDVANDVFDEEFKTFEEKYEGEEFDDVLEEKKITLYNQMIELSSQIDDKEFNKLTQLLEYNRKQHFESWREIYEGEEDEFETSDKEIQNWINWKKTKMEKEKKRKLGWKK